MNENSLKTDFLLFEQKYFKHISSKYNNFYSLLDFPYITDMILTNLRKNFLKSQNLDRLFQKDLIYLNNLLCSRKINFNEFTHFKDENDILFAYLLFFEIKVFSLNFKKSKNNFEFYDSAIKELLFDRNDFINLYIDYIYKFFLFNEIMGGEVLQKNKNDFRVFSFRFVECCIKNGLIVSRDIKTKKRHYKSLKFKLFIIPHVPEIVLNTTKFSIYLHQDVYPYIYSSHFSSLLLMTKQASYSTSTFKIPSSQIDAILDRIVYIDRDLLKTNFLFLLENAGYSEETDLNAMNLELSTKISKFIQEKDLESLKIYHSKFSKLLDLIRIKSILLMDFDNKELYMPFMFCFRGRIYDLGNFSYTFYKEFRFSTFSGEYGSAEYEKFHPINAQINSTIDDYFSFFQKYDWFESLSLIRKRACVWIFISLGVMKKTELGKKVHISAFILKGQNLWEEGNLNNFQDVYERIEYNYLIFLINELRNSKNLKKFIFWKDATASCFQHLLLILGEKDEESYKICNLNSTDCWYDPYSYLITDFFEKKRKEFSERLKIKFNLLLDEKKFFLIFSRQRLKKVIMTETYGAGFSKLTYYFLLDLDLSEFSEEEKEEILKIWEELFSYLSSENILFSQSSKAINDYFVSKNIKKIINPDNSEIDYSCYVIQIIQKELYIEKKRHTYQTRTITTNFDKKQFETSLRANFVQSCDAILARRYIADTRMWTVHDCFSMDFLNITFMVSTVNDLMNRDFYDIGINLKGKRHVYSIFIII